MKKRIKIIIVLLLISGIIINVRAIEEPERGDLRCPKTSSGSTTCKEVKDSSGRVIEVQVSTKQDNVTITKYVRKTDTTGEYEVQFGVSGQGQTSSSKNAYVMLILDGSSSIGANYKKVVVKAAKKFANILHENSDNIYLAFASFHYKVFASRDFSKDVFKDSQFGTNEAQKCINHGPPCYLVGSHIYRAFDVAESYFKKVDGRKYLVILGDNRYSVGKGSNCQKEREGVCDLPDGHKEINVLKGMVDAIYSVNYGITGKAKEQYLQGFVKSPGYYTKSGLSEKMFDTIAEQIGLDIKITTVSGTVTDRLGSHFSLSSGKLSWTFTKISSQEVLSQPFKIRIDRSVKDGWYPTNDGFSFILGDKVIKPSIDPEVYWKQEEKYFDSCSDKINWTESDNHNYVYYNVKCEEGYGNLVGYQATLKVNGLPLDTRKLSLGYGRGFETSLELKNNIRCTYSFDYNKYNKRMNEIISKIDSLPDNNKLKAEYLKEKKTMQDTLNSYQDLTVNKSRLNEEKNHFENQSATLIVKDSSTGKIKQTNLINETILESNLKINCSFNEKQTIIYDKNETKKVDTIATCSVNFEKKMKLPETCLNMQTGLQEICSNDLKNQISGGNYFYPDLDVKKGFISLLVPASGYFKSDIRLDGEKNDKVDGKDNPRCEFNVGNRNVPIYRQIELADPFLKNYSNDRKTGKNWLNNKYDFQNIIDKNTWTNDFEYKYQMSKVNVENIKNTTIGANERVNSYLGTDCYFNSSNKYICSFVGRNNEEVKEFFSNVIIHE